MSHDVVVAACWAALVAAVAWSEPDWRPLSTGWSTRHQSGARIHLAPAPTGPVEALRRRVADHVIRARAPW